MNAEYLIPTNSLDSDNEPRKAGFELEFGDVTVKETAEGIRDSLGGNLEQENPFRFIVHDTIVGDLKIERDAELLHSVKYKAYLENVDLDGDFQIMLNEIGDGVDKLSSILIPCEVVTSPVPFKLFPELNKIVSLLENLGARGTQHSMFYAFGLHINPSVPDLKADTLLSYIQGFLLLADWIIEDSGINFSRRFFTSYIDPFPESYIRKVLDNDYRPGMQDLLEDYLVENPTRNRALDMLPIFCEIDNRKVKQAVNNAEESLVHGRPAFHYRLPDCRIGDAEWSIAAEWNRWWYVEELAADTSLLSELIMVRKDVMGGSLLNRKNVWVKKVRNFLAEKLPLGKSL